MCEAAIQALDAALAQPRDARPGAALTRAIVAIASQKRNPIPFDQFAQLYVLALNVLDPASALSTSIRAYFAQKPYQYEVTLCINSYNGRTPYNKTRESRRPGFMRPWRTYSPYEIMYKWSVATMQATFMPIMEEIITVHKYAAVMNIFMRGGGCEAINTPENQDNLANFTVAYESLRGRPYLADNPGASDELAIANAADRAHQMTLYYLGSRAKPDGVTAQNLPRDSPDYTGVVRQNLDKLEIVKRKINCSYSVPKIRNSEIWFTRKPTTQDPPAASRILTRKNTPFAAPSASGRQTPSPASSDSDSDSSDSDSDSSDSDSDSSPPPRPAPAAESSIRITITGGTVTINICDCCF